MDKYLLIFSCTALIYISSFNSIEANNSKRAKYDGEEILFPDAYEKLLKGMRRANNPQHKKVDNKTIETEMPLELAKRLNEVDDLDEFLENYVSNKDEFLRDTRIEIPDDVPSRFGNVKSASAASPIAKMAACTPEMTVVNLIPEKVDYSVIHLPPCTRVLRCSGCCHNNLLQCEPTTTIMKTFKIYEISRVGKRYKKFLNVSVEEHTACSCECIVKEKDCNSRQRYSSGLCRCECLDEKSELECSSTPGHFWNLDTCTCDCWDTFECSTGSYFDDLTCNCI